jgi:uncharacterized caspase-like protein
VEDGLYEEKATSQGILERLAKIAQVMKEEDVLFLFFSGHGVVPWGQEMFFFAPWDMRGPDPQLESESGFSTALLAEVIREMPSLRMFIVIDACQSGGALESLAKVAQAKAVDAATTDRSPKASTPHQEPGIYIVASATPLQRAEQIAGLAGSPLVAALIDAMKRGKGSETVSAREVANFIHSQTPKGNAIGNVPIPMTVATGVDFPLTRRK